MMVKAWQLKATVAQDKFGELGGGWTIQGFVGHGRDICVVFQIQWEAIEEFLTESDMV